MKKTLLLCLVSLVSSLSAFAVEPFPNAGVRKNLVLSLAKEMERLDGEGLYVRRNRENSWQEIVNVLASDAEKSKDYAEFLRVFSRLDQAYPNTHSFFDTGEEYYDFENNPIGPDIRFDTEWNSIHETRVVVTAVGNTAKLPESDRPLQGDEIVAINSRNIDSWKEENFEFCKWPLKEQCDFMLYSAFRKEFLSWERNQPLFYTLKRENRTWTIPVTISERKSKKHIPEEYLCYKEQDRYQGFKLVYQGSRACVFQKNNDPNTAILRITSFQYRLVLPEEKIHSPQEEINAIYPWWTKNATWKHLIIDLIDNGGGRAPIPYYQILFRKPFQEQWAQWKKNPEVLNDRLREGMDWGEPAQELWFQNILKSGQWNSIADRDYLPAFPMFCVNDSIPCDQGLFQPLEHPFEGRVTLLVNQFCVSSCDGFVFAIKDQLAERVRIVGQPQAADTAYSRLTINVKLDAKVANGFTLEIVPIRDENSKKVFLNQTVSVSRSVDSAGVIQSGEPLAVDRFVPSTRENFGSWPSDALAEALWE